MLKLVVLIWKPLVGLCTGLINLCVAEPGATLGVVGLFISILKRTAVSGLVILAKLSYCRTFCARGARYLSIRAEYNARLLSQGALHTSHALTTFIKFTSKNAFRPLLPKSV
jgi:hypothetical protein